MNIGKKSAISFMEIVFTVFVLLFIYSFVVKQIIADIKFSGMKEYAASTYNVFDSASKTILNNGGYVNRFYSEQDIINTFSHIIKADKICNDSMREYCWSNNWLWEAAKEKPGFVMHDGQYVVAEFLSYSCSSNLNIPNTCGALYIDINGSKSPNIIGQDIIKIYITSEGLVPAGAHNDIFNPKKNCDLISKFNWGCTAKLVGKD